MSKYFNIFKELIIFIFIFSLFNDTYLVELFGEHILKIIFLTFVIININTIYKMVFVTKHSIEIKLFFLFLFSILISTLVTSIIYFRESLIGDILLLIGNFIVFIFFSYFNIRKTIVYSWLSIIFSIIVCYYAVPISEWTFRKSGGTGDPNEFATQLLFFLMIGYYIYLEKKKLLVLLITLVLFLYGIFYAASMSSFIALVFMGLIFIYTYTKTNLTKTIIYLMVVIVFLLLSYDFILHIEVVQNMLHRSDNLNTAEQRFIAWKVGYEMIQDYTVFGVGQTSFPDVAVKYLGLNPNKGLLWPHNVFIQLFSTSGLLSFFIYDIFLLVLFLKDYKKNLSKYTLPFFIAIFGVIVMSGTLGLLYKKFFWFFLAIFYNVKTTNNKGKI